MIKGNTMKKNYLISIGCILLLSSNLFWAQQAGPIEINPFIGATLDRVERDYFHLFPKIEGFQEALFLLNPDSTLRVNIIYEKDGNFRDTVLNNYKSPRMIQNHIDQFLTNIINNIRSDLKGRFTDVLLIDRSKISGELLIVRQNSVLLYGMSEKSYEDKERVLFNVDNIQKKDINNVYVREKSKTLSIIYPIIGAIVGGIIGYNIANKSEPYRNPNQFYLVSRDAEKKVKSFWGILVGCVIGGLVTLPLAYIFPIETVSETVFEAPFDEEEIVGLRSFARHYNYEPYYLRKIK